MHNLFLIAAGMMLGGLLTASITLNYADIIEGVSHENLTLPFQQAGERIEGLEIKSYDELLVEKINPHLAGPDKTGVDRYLPDIEGVYHESLTTPFQQAGQQMEDPDLKAAYDRVVSEIGQDK